MKNAKILVVDDEPGWRDLLAMEFAAEHDVVLAADTQEAQKLMANQAFDVIITDVRMPGKMDGIDLIQGYRRKVNPVQKAIFITGYALEEKIQKVLAEGSGVCLRKPFELDSLRQAVQTLLSI